MPIVIPGRQGRGSALSDALNALARGGLARIARSDQLRQQDRADRQLDITEDRNRTSAALTARGQDIDVANAQQSRALKERLAGMSDTNAITLEGMQQAGIDARDKARREALLGRQIFEKTGIMADTFDEQVGIVEQRARELGMSVEDFLIRNQMRQAGFEHGLDPRQKDRVQQLMQARNSVLSDPTFGTPSFPGGPPQRDGALKAIDERMRAIQPGFFQSSQKNLPTIQEQIQSGHIEPHPEFGGAYITDPATGKTTFARFNPPKGGAQGGAEPMDRGDLSKLLKAANDTIPPRFDGESNPVEPTKAESDAALLKQLELAERFEGKTPAEMAAVLRQERDGAAKKHAFEQSQITLNGLMASLDAGVLTPDTIAQRPDLIQQIDEAVRLAQASNNELAGANTGWAKWYMLQAASELGAGSDVETVRKRAAELATQAGWKL